MRSPTVWKASGWPARLAVIAVAVGVLLVAAVIAPAAEDGESEEEAGNNLSVPVIWSDGELALVGTYGEPSFGGASVPLPSEANGIVYDWYLQQDPGNAWQAETLDASAEGIGPVKVSYVDWGDNLEAKSWPLGSPVRVETTLIEELGSDPELSGHETMTGFEMQHISGQGQTEMWGTNGRTFESEQALIYSGCARLTIQRLTVPRDELSEGEGSLAWDADAAEWTGSQIEAPLFNGGVWEGGDGPGAYGAEINVSGRVVYGYNWSTEGLQPADYRLTFSLDERHCPVTLNTSLQGAQIFVTEESEEEEEEGGGGPPGAGSGAATAAEDEGSTHEGGGATPVIDEANDLSYIDVRLTSGGGGGGG